MLARLFLPVLGAFLFIFSTDPFALAQEMNLDFRQIFLDDSIVVRRENAEKIYHQAKTLPHRLLSCETPVERDKLWIDRPSVIRDEKTGKFRMWYQVWATEKENHHYWTTLFAESDDGLAWTRPRVGKFPFRGDAGANNIVLEEWLRTVLPNPAGDGYVALVVRPEQFLHLDAAGTGVTDTKAVPSISRDHITGFAELRTVQPKAVSDEARIMWDAPSARYFGTFKTGLPVPGSVVAERYRRGVAFAWSGNGIKWDFNGKTFTADREDDDYLGAQAYVDHTRPAWLEIDDMPVFRYQNLIIGLMSCMYMYNGEGGGMNGETFLAWSRNGGDWQRTHPREPFIAGPKDSFMYGEFRAGATPPIRVGDELWFYHGVGGDQRNHNHHVYNPDGMGITLSKLRVDGFASLRAGEKEAIVETVAFPLRGGTARVNGDFSKGRCVVELVEADSGSVLLASQPITTDGVSIAVPWPSEQLARWKDKKCFLRFRFHGGEIYSFGFDKA